MDRIEFINFLIQQRNANRYLEIGVHTDQITFAHIRCAYKLTTYPLSSDEFFNRKRELFDIIFIDSVHTEEQTRKDIDYALENLRTDGIVVLHDCMPPDAWHQREWEAYKEGENWNGTTWKAVLRTFNETAFKCTLIDMDWGCGVMDTAKTQIPKRLSLPKNLDYEQHYILLLEYKKSVSAYLRESVKVFYHLACMGNWQDVFKEQMQVMQQNGFQKPILTVLGTKENVQTTQRISEELEVNVQIIFVSEVLTQFEQPAMLAIEEYAKKDNNFVLYLHSKGVSNPADGTKCKWRRLMMRELVQNWEYCMLQLPKFDSIGVNWRDMPPISHFCGNFWYASTQYLRKLADFKYYYDHPPYSMGDPINSKRLGCEFWISSGKEAPKVLSLFCRNVDFCNASYWVNK